MSGLGMHAHEYESGEELQEDDDVIDENPITLDKATSAVSGSSWNKQRTFGSGFEVHIHC